MRSWVDMYEAQRAERRAVLWGQQWFTYGMLAARARRLAAFLHQQGVATGDAVGILAHNHIAHLDLIAACDLIGAAYAPLNYRLSEPEQGDTLKALDPRLVFVDADNAGKLPQGSPRAIALADYERLLGAQRNAKPPRDVRDGERVAMLLLTGGSTGTPKAAMIPRRQIAANNTHTVQGWALRGDDCVVQASPAFHAGINVLTTPLLSIGGRVILTDNFSPTQYLSAVEQHRATVLFLVPTMYQMLADAPGFADTDLSSVRFAISGGAACPAPLCHVFADKDVPFRQGYGLTEAGVNCFAMTEFEADACPNAVGRPMPGTQVVLRSPDGMPVQPGEVGEITIAGPHVFLGYRGRPEETANALRDGWLWTGDLAQQDEHGLFTIVGRRKEMFISGGENVFPPEVEAAIAAHPDVSEVAVFGIPHPHWGEVGVAAIAPYRLGTDALRRWLKPQLAGYKIPKHVMAMDSLPLTGAGKVDKQVLRARAINRFAEEAENDAA